MKKPMRRTFSDYRTNHEILAACCYAILFSGLLVRAADEPSILIVNSYHQGFPWSDGEIEGISKRLQEKYPNLQPCIEHLDAKRLADMPHGGATKDLFATKFAGRKFEVVFAVDNPALEFTIATRKELFPDAAVVFCGINGFSSEMLAGQSRITGVAELFVNALPPP
jgi:hypothetical protein